MHITELAVRLAAIAAAPARHYPVIGYAIAAGIVLFVILPLTRSLLNDVRRKRAERQAAASTAEQVQFLQDLAGQGITVQPTRPE